MSYVALKSGLDSTPTFSSDDSDLGHLQLHPTDGAPRSHRQRAHSCLESGRDTGGGRVGVSGEGGVGVSGEGGVGVSDEEGVGVSGEGGVGMSGEEGVGVSGEGGVGVSDEDGVGVPGD